MLHISSIFSWLRYDQSLNTSRLWREDLGWQTETYKTQRWNNSRLSETSPGSRSSNFSANSFFLFFKQNNFFQKTGSQGVRESAAPLTWSSFFCNLTFAAESIRIDYFVSRSEEIFRFQKSGSLAESNERPAFIKWLFVLFLHSVIRQNLRSLESASTSRDTCTQPTTTTTTTVRTEAYRNDVSLFRRRIRWNMACYRFSLFNFAACLNECIPPETMLTLRFQQSRIIFLIIPHLRILL